MMERLSDLKHVEDIAEAMLRIGTALPAEWRDLMWTLVVEISRLREQVIELTALLGRNSRNSSLPPSKDGRQRSAGGGASSDGPC